MAGHYVTIFMNSVGKGLMIVNNIKNISKLIDNNIIFAFYTKHAYYIIIICMYIFSINTLLMPIYYAPNY